MKKYLVNVLAICLLAPFSYGAVSSLDGNWRTEDGSKLIPIHEFNGSATLSTSSYYGNGAAVNWFFIYQLPQGRDPQVGETLPGRVRSVDAYYNCVFDEKAEAQLQAPGILKIHYPLLSYHRETRSARDGQGYYQQRTVDWTGWGWVETAYGFPMDHYRVVSSECVIDQQNWVTSVLTKTNAPF